LDEHGSNPLQADDVEDEDAKDGEAGGDVDEIFHGRIRFDAMGSRKSGIGRKGVTVPFERGTATVRKS
jgi:hypothetical protein